MINNCIIIGRLTKDVELKKTNTGLSVASFTVACDRDQKKQDGSHDTDFIQCQAWRQTAEYLAQYAEKGSLVAVNGRMQTRSYDRQDGSKAYVTEIIVQTANILSYKQSTKSREPASMASATYYTNPKTEKQFQNNAKYEPEGAEFDDLGISSDDLPF